jgi:hypothetical protein
MCEKKHTSQVWNGFGLAFFADFFDVRDINRLDILIHAWISVKKTSNLTPTRY